MTYETLLQEAFEQLPAFRQAYEEEIKSGLLDVEDGMHIVFGQVFTPLLAESIKAHHTEIYKPMISFMEQMELCEDILVTEVCEFTILERLTDDFADEEIYPLLGPDTREGYKAVRQYMGDKNTVLPSQRKQ